jgi:hypothetical protein
VLFEALVAGTSAKAVHCMATTHGSPCPGPVVPASAPVGSAACNGLAGSSAVVAWLYLLEETCGRVGQARTTSGTSVWRRANRLGLDARQSHQTPIRKGHRLDQRPNEWQVRLLCGGPSMGSLELAERLPLRWPGERNWNPGALAPAGRYSVESALAQLHPVFGYTSPRLAIAFDLWAGALIAAGLLPQGRQRSRTVDRARGFFTPKSRLRGARGRQYRDRPFGREGAGVRNPAVPHHPPVDPPALTPADDAGVTSRVHRGGSQVFRSACGRVYRALRVNAYKRSPHDSGLFSFSERLDR